MSKKRGKLVSLVGGEGSGKTTCIQELKKHVDADLFVFSREPGGTEMAEKARSAFFDLDLNPFEELLAVQIARSIHFRQKINPALEKGIHVITDRCYESTWAYQIVAGSKNDKRLHKIFDDINLLACDGTEVDLFIDFDIPVEKSIGRKLGDAGEINRFDTMPLDYHHAVRSGFDDFLSLPHIKHKVVKIDAEAPEQHVLSQVTKALDKHILK